MDNIQRRICLYGGPGLGKSTAAAWLFAKLKIAGCDIEHVQEYVKGWAFIGQAPQSFDQIYIFGKQLHKEDIILRNGHSSIITESPLYLCACYGVKYNTPGTAQLISLIQEFDARYPAVSILLDRGDCKYQQFGRFQNEDQAREVDMEIKSLLDRHAVPYETVMYNDLEGLLEIASGALGC